MKQTTETLRPTSRPQIVLPQALNESTTTDASSTACASANLSRSPNMPRTCQFVFRCSLAGPRSRRFRRKRAPVDERSATSACQTCGGKSPSKTAATRTAAPAVRHRLQYMNMQHSSHFYHLTNISHHVHVNFHSSSFHSKLFCFF